MTYTNDLPGWMHPDNLQWLYDRAQEMESVVEIGSAWGRSTSALCSGCQGHVVAIDDWVTIPGHTPEQAEEIYQQFRRNMAGFSNLSIVRKPSAEALTYFADRAFDMSFIDGAHDYASVVRDIAMAERVTRKLLCGHDYWPTHPGVIRAVDEYSERADKLVRHVGEAIWAVWL